MNESNQNDRIKRKIVALLSKTVDNGASEAEAEAALNKANQLMTEYYIEQHELNDPYLSEKCVVEQVDRFQSQYDFTFFLGALCNLFDCNNVFNKRTVFFFGFKEDVSLCSFFYGLIIRSCLAEKDKYVKTNRFRNDKKYYPSKTLISSFIKGFLISISLKMNEMYQYRKSSLPVGMGIVLADKKQRVDSEFEDAFHGVKAKKQARASVVREVYEYGKKRGSDFHITQGINTAKNETTLKLAM